MTIVVRKGNPKGIKDWDDLLKPGVEVVTPNPFSSGSAKWNLLAPYAAKSDGGKNPQAGLDYLSALVSDHVKIQPKSGREATETFLQGTGDVLLSYENEAMFVERNGEPVEHVTPPDDVQDREPGRRAVQAARTAATAKAFNDFLYTPEAQTLWAEAGFRPVDQAVAAGVRGRLPGAEEALDDRRPRRLEGRQRRALHEGHRLHRHDLRRGHQVGMAMSTETLAGRASPPPPQRAPAASLPPLGPGPDPRRRPRPRHRGGLPLAERDRPAAAGGPDGHLVRGRPRGLLGRGHRARRAGRPAGHRLVSVVVALINVVMGTLIAWVLVRDDFRGKRFVNALIDLPFALPTIVASIVLLSLYGPNSPIGIHLNATQPGLIVALAFVTLPFVVRSVQPVLIEVDREVEEAAASLGADNWTTFRRVVLPTLAPAMLSGAGLAFARAIGEYGSVVLIGGNIPRETQVASQYIQQQIEIDRPANAAAVSVALLAIAFVTLFLLRLFIARAQRREESAQ